MPEPAIIVTTWNRQPFGPRYVSDEHAIAAALNHSRTTGDQARIVYADGAERHTV